MAVGHSVSAKVAGSRPATSSGRLRRVGEVAFALWLILSLITPSWRYGPFAWLPLWEYEELAGAPMRVGVANLLPVVVVVCTVVVRWRADTGRTWTWGPPALSLPLAGLTILGTLRLDTSNFRLVFIYAGMYAVAWLVYLYVLNERPRLLAPIAVVLLIQGAIAIGQFVAQRDLGLLPLGELPLHPAHEGNSVLVARGQPWLRAYGLTIHPNLLGALLAALLLLVLPALGRRGAGERGSRGELPHPLGEGWREGRSAPEAADSAPATRPHLTTRTQRLALAAAVVVGGAGLFLSFSRAAWLGLAAGLVAWGACAWWGQRLSCVAPSAVRRTFFAPRRGIRESDKKVQRTSESAMHRARRVGPWLLGGALLALLLFGYRDLVFSRLFSLDTPTEAQSITDRQRDAALALAVIRDAPLTGVGLGEYLDAAQRLDADAARVHNVPLLVAAELGLPGLALWLWLMVAPFWLWLRPGASRRARYATLGPRLAPWVAMLVINTFDTTLWLSGNWQTAILFALVAANSVSSKVSSSQY